LLFKWELTSVATTAVAMDVFTVTMTDEITGIFTVTIIEAFAVYVKPSIRPVNEIV
jgi:hypothetical protein